MLDLANGLLVMGGESVTISMTCHEVDTTFDLELKEDTRIAMLDELDHSLATYWLATSGPRGSSQEAARLGGQVVARW